MADPSAPTTDRWWDMLKSGELDQVDWRCMELSMQQEYLNFLKGIVPWQLGVFLTPELLESLKMPAAILREMLSTDPAQEKLEDPGQNQSIYQPVGTLESTPNIIWLSLPAAEVAALYIEAIGIKKAGADSDAASGYTQIEIQDASNLLSELRHYLAGHDLISSSSNKLADRLHQGAVRDEIYKISAAANGGVLPFDIAVDVATSRLKTAFDSKNSANKHFLLGMLTIDSYKGDVDWSDAVIKRMLQDQQDYATFWALRIAVIWTEGRYILPALEQWKRDFLGGFIEPPAKPRGKQPYESLHRDLLIVGELRAMTGYGLAPTRAKESQHIPSGCDAIAAALSCLGNARSYAAVENIWVARSQFRHPSLLRVQTPF